MENFVLRFILFSLIYISVSVLVMVTRARMYYNVFKTKKMLGDGCFAIRRVGAGNILTKMMWPYQHIMIKKGEEKKVKLQYAPFIYTPPSREINPLSIMEFVIAGPVLLAMPPITLLVAMISIFMKWINTNYMS